MKIGIISDTHGNVPAWHKAMVRFAGADLIIHAGDILYHPPRLGRRPGYDVPGLVELLNACPIPIVLARGNCDAEVYEELLDIPVLSPYAFVQSGGLRIAVSHGHTLTPESIRRLAERGQTDLLVTGHTHLPAVERIGGMIHVNPGSPAHPKLERNGVLTPTVGLIQDGKVAIIDLETGDEIISMPLI